MERFNKDSYQNLPEHQLKPIETRIAISALLETSLEALPLDKQLIHALDIILSISWLSMEYKGSIFLLNEETGKLELAAQRFLHKHMQTNCAVIDIGQCLCGLAAERREIVFKNCIDHDHSITFEGMHEHGHYCIPIMKQERLLGVLNLYASHKHVRTSEEDAVLTTVANTLAGIIESRCVEDALEKERHFISTVLDTTSALVTVLSPQGEIEQINRAYETLSGFPAANVLDKYIWDPTLTIAEDAARLQECILQAATGENPNVCESRCRTKDGTTRTVSWANTVLTDLDGNVKKIIATGIDITKHREAEKRLEHLAHNDSLTGLPNRYLFIELLGQSLMHARRNKGQVAVMFMDLDHFKAVNDDMGHNIGDMLLVAVAKRIRQTLRDSDIVARLGGDEFTVILSENGPAIQDLTIVGEKITNALQEPFHIEQNICRIGSSIGISRFPEDGNSSEILLKKADMAMYAVKKNGRNQHLLYSPDMERVLKQSLNTE
jgi:diguanylate cyclase (GGDEF)-like protein/PAS domain S-box-containing protein